MTSLKQTTLTDFLDQLAAGTATPGGGGVAAMTGAMGASLVSMVCGLTLGRKKYADVEAEVQAILAEAETLRETLTALIDEDAVAYGSLMDAFRRPKDDPQRGEAIQAGAKAAALVPLQIAQACARVIELAHQIADVGNQNAINDAEMAQFCAETAIKGSVDNVDTNLAMIKDAAFIAEQEAALDKLLAAVSA